MKKRTTYAFGKKIYLLGKGEDGSYYWLKKSTWDCDWYWGMGYVRTYTNNKNPERAKDIKTHQHFNGLFFNNRNMNGYDAFKNFFEETVLSDRELWQLLELFKTAYLLKETADVLGHGGSNYTTNICKNIIINKDEVDRINKIV